VNCGVAYQDVFFCPAVAQNARTCFKTLESPHPHSWGLPNRLQKSPNLGGLKPFGHTRKGGRSFSNEAIRSFKIQPSLVCEDRRGKAETSRSLNLIDDVL
jgi:hypothetical protein